MAFWMRGNTPPPTTIIMKMPEAAAVYLPRPSVARLKMQLHITDVHKPHNTSNNALRGTSCISKAEPVNNGMVVVWSLPTNMAPRMSNMPSEVTTTIMVRDDTLLAIAPPTMRPTSISNQ